jgi:hypothetical protein
LWFAVDESEDPKETDTWDGLKLSDVKNIPSITDAQFVARGQSYRHALEQVRADFEKCIRYGPNPKTHRHTEDFKA